MKHLNVRWNPVTREWLCATCGRTSDEPSIGAAHKKLDQYECQIPSVEAPRAEPGTETVRLIKKPYKMTLKTEQSGSRFVVSKMDDGRPLIRLELFHDTASRLEPFTLGFEVLSGDAMNERIVGVIVTSKG